jgi:hypothetical protein
VLSHFDHTTQLFNHDLSFSVSMLQLTGCPPQAFSRTSAVLCNQSHSRLSLFPSLCRHLVTIAIRLVQPSLYLWSIMLSYESRHSAAVLHSTCVPSPPFTSARRFRQESTLLSTSSQSFKLSSRFHPVAVHFRRPLHPRHESQHQSLTGVRPLERAYCHEPCYVSCGLKS